MPNKEISTTGNLVDMPSALQECIATCLECFKVCTHTLSHCLTKGNEHMKPDHVRLMQDCAKVCEASADFMLRHSENHALICGVCAEVCYSCAKSCEAFVDDPMMHDCARVCRTCATSCEEMSNMH